MEPDLVLKPRPVSVCLAADGLCALKNSKEVMSLKFLRPIHSIYSPFASTYLIMATGLVSYQAI